MKSSELQNELKHICMKINSCSWCCQHQVGPAHHRLRNWSRPQSFQDFTGRWFSRIGWDKTVPTSMPSPWGHIFGLIWRWQGRSEWFLIHTAAGAHHSDPPLMEATRSQLEQQTLGKTPAKLNFKQLWFRWAMRSVELPTSLLGLGCDQWKGTQPTHLIHHFLSLKLSRPTDPSGEERTPFPSLLAPDFLKPGSFLGEHQWCWGARRNKKYSPYFWCSKCRAPHKPVVLEPHSCGTHSGTNLYNPPHHSTWTGEKNKNIIKKRHKTQWSLRSSPTQMIPKGKGKGNFYLKVFKQVENKVGIK